MPTLTTYTKDTESNILSNPPSADGELAFATDTYKLYISNGTNWVDYQARKIYGNYDLTESITISNKPMYHLDFSDISSILNSNSSQPSNGDGVAEITCKSTNRKLISEIATEQPTYVSASGTSIMGETTGDARIGGLNTAQFDGTQFLAYDYNGQSSYHRSNSYTGIIVARLATLSGNTGGWTSIYGSSYEGYALTYRDNYSHSYFNIGFGYSSLNITPPTSSIPNLNQAGNYPFILVIRHGSNKSTYTVVADCNSNNSQGHYTYNANNPFPPIHLHGMMLGANYIYKTNANRLHGEIGEFLFFDSMLNNNQINTITNHLATKWSLNWSNI